MKFIILTLMLAATLVAPENASGQYCWNCDWEGTTCLNDQLSGVEGCTGACIEWGQCGVAYGCLLAGTQISVPGGTMPIESIRVGDIVISGTDGAPRPVPVRSVFEVLAEGYIEINGNILATSDHPFMVGGIWKKAGDLLLGDALDGSQFHLL